MTPERRRFFRQLPLQLAMCGWSVRLSERPNEAVGFEVLREADTAPVSFDPSNDWKWYNFHKQGHITASRDELKPFFKAYLKCPAGVSVLTFGERESVSAKRIRALTYSFDAWRRLSGPRGRDGRLKEALNCIAYVKVGDVHWDGCNNRTKETSGLCRHHNKPDAETLWNHDPFSPLEAAWKKLDSFAQQIADQQDQDDARRAEELEEERARRKARWHRVAETIEYTATDRQIYFLLDLGADPQQLNRIGKEKASDLIDRLLGD